MVMQIATALRTGLHSVPAIKLGLDNLILIMQDVHVVVGSKRSSVQLTEDGSAYVTV